MHGDIGMSGMPHLGRLQFGVSHGVNSDPFLLTP